MRRLKAVFFDLDGTLVLFKIDYILARKTAFGILEKYGIPKNKYTTKNSIRTSIEEAKLYFKEKLNYTPEKIKRILEEVNNAVQKIEMMAVKEATPVKGSLSLLKFLRERGVLNIIITYNTHIAAELTLKNAGLIDYIDDIYARDDVERPKPDHEHIKIAADKYQVSPEESIMVGDFEGDILAGKGFGCLTVGVQTGHNLNRLDTPDFIIQQEELKDGLMKIIKDYFDL
ncbi:MAG: HAD family hydrolase [Promethearchaeota archaeon]